MIDWAEFLIRGSHRSLEIVQDHYLSGGGIPVGIPTILKGVVLANVWAPQ